MDLKTVIRATIREMQGDRIAYTESEAAALMGVKRHVLRDLRLRGELPASRLGRRVVYLRKDLLDYLEQQRLD